MSNSAAQEFVRLVEIMATLRSPDGCPWDREQTIDSLKPFVLEETYEVLEAIDRHDHAALCEELGDFMFEAVFLAQMEAEAGHFTIADSLKAIADKLVRRHPHVFARGDGAATLDSAAAVRVRWEDLKARERQEWRDRQEGRGGVSSARTLLSGIAPALPALLRAYHIGLRAASVNFDWTRTEDVMRKIQEEVDELREVVEAPDALDLARAEDEMGDLLFSIANLSRKLGIEPETALRKANDKFTRRFTDMEQAIAGTGRAMSEMSLDALEAEWQRTKSVHQTR
ncbi:MAG TPA: nucleoside triphosphate pyrophosphohydrolase [Vicinamibacterales bacterium]|jgi:ATP diphosphatase|nr:nucleoside triphosphate pyrophosphohydrolase [Vicinamibacterales bacterium]